MTTPRPLLPPSPAADALEGWERAGAEDGSLPIQFARRTGAAAVVERLIALRRFEAASKAAEATKPCPCACGPEGDAAAPPAPAAVGVPAGATKATLVHRGIKAAGDSASSSRTPSKDLVGECGGGVSQCRAGARFVLWREPGCTGGAALRAPGRAGALLGCLAQTACCPVESYLLNKDCQSCLQLIQVALSLI